MPKTVPETPGGPEPIGPYSIATEANGLVFVSGQVAIHPETGLGVNGGVGEQTRRVMENIGTILADVGLHYSDIVKTTIFLADIKDFPEVNSIYGGYFEGPPPARSAFQAGALPGGYLVEIEVVAAR